MLKPAKHRPASQFDRKCQPPDKKCNTMGIARCSESALALPDEQAALLLALRVSYNPRVGW